MPLGSVDIADVLAADADALATLSRLPGQMRAAAQLGAQYEREHKTYQNRTFRLIRNTKAVVDKSTAAQVVVVLQMDTEYASYVKARGFSAIEQAAALTKSAIGDAIESVGARLGK